MYKLYIGNETYLSLSNAQLTIKELLKEKNFEYILIDGERIDSSKIMDTLSSQSLFNTPRVIFLKRLYRNKDRENLIPSVLEYIEKNSENHMVIWEDQKVNSITRYVKFFKSKNLLEEYNKFTKPSFIKYAKERCQKYNLDIDTTLVTLLSQHSNYDTERLENNIKKLQLLSKDGKVEKNDIEEIVQDTLEEDIWRLLDEMNINNGKPLSILEKIFNQAIEPTYIFPMIVRNIRLITLTKYLSTNNYSTSEIASILKIPPFTVRPLIEAGRKYTWEKITNKYEKLSNLDYEIKVGRIDPKLGLTLFCTTI